ncbi:hypothetical protein HUO09_17495 [Vibrio sp. Y2-5]|uniref:hypothetical protein n=1 Tax=Vibrio sp. Y2-5 TaxID=2743977 RepID=UPI0016605904|nr:hypothetical protein [Vibrio sp. Y2-5]MBD0788152.1 hypothetical protein [Vibrio sp. Y2-5]
MTTSLEALASNNIQTTKQPNKRRIRENTDLFNMMLRATDISDFHNPFGSCDKTFTKYSLHAQSLLKIGINQVHSYDTALMKRTCDLIGKISERYLPSYQSGIKSNDDFYKIITDLNQIKEALTKFKFSNENKIVLTDSLISLTDVIYQTSHLLQLHKCIKQGNGSIAETIYNHTTISFVEVFSKALEILKVEAHCAKEGGVNRREIYYLRAIVIAIIFYQVEILRNPDVDLNSVVIGDIIWTDRIISSVLSI